jgi:hypothetical protein
MISLLGADTNDISAKSKPRHKQAKRSEIKRRANGKRRGHSSEAPELSSEAGKRFARCAMRDQGPSETSRQLASGCGSSSTQRSVRVDALADYPRNNRYFDASEKVS